MIKLGTLMLNPRYVMGTRALDGMRILVRMSDKREIVHECADYQEQARILTEIDQAVTRVNAA